MAITSLHTESFEDFLKSESVVINKENKTVLRIPFSMHIALEQIRAGWSNDSKTMLQTSALEKGIDELVSRFAEDIKTYRGHVEQSKEYFIDINDYSTEMTFGKHWKPRMEERLDYKIMIYPADGVRNRIDLLEEVSGASGGWIQRCAIAQSLLMSDHIASGDQSKIQMSSYFNKYIKHVTDRIKARNNMMNVWLGTKEIEAKDRERN